jgi:hypothetical protein
MSWIQSCDAPDLTDLDIPVIRFYLLKLTFHNAGGHENAEVRAYIHAFILGCDKAIRVYQRGRERLEDYVASDNAFTILLEGLGEFETCINSTRRCLTLADRMARHPKNPEIDRQLRKLLESYQSEVRMIRDAIEHMDEKIAAVDGVNESGLLKVSRDGERLEIGSYDLRFDVLANCLRRIHGLAVALASRQRVDNTLGFLDQS